MQCICPTGTAGSAFQSQQRSTKLEHAVHSEGNQSKVLGSPHMVQVAAKICCDPERANLLIGILQCCGGMTPYWKVHNALRCRWCIGILHKQAQEWTLLAD